MCLTDHVLHQYRPVDDSVCLQLKDSEEMADKKPREALRLSCSSVALSNPLHSVLSLHRRCKDTIVLTVLQPHQVRIMRRLLAFMFLSPRISLIFHQSSLFSPHSTFPLFSPFSLYNHTGKRDIQYSFPTVHTSAVQTHISAHDHDYAFIYFSGKCSHVGTETPTGDLNEKILLVRSSTQRKWKQHLVAL